MLARIHRTPFSAADKLFLMDDNVEVAWFIKGGVIPDYMRADPDGEMVWNLVNGHWGKWGPVESHFAHTDYWSGNILWQGDQISAVVDWEEAGYGHPAADVAYARMEYYLEGLPEAADVFLRVYQEEAGWSVTDLALFELAASARVMTDPPGWFTRPQYGRALSPLCRGCEAKADFNPPLNLPPKHQGETCLGLWQYLVIHITIIALIADFGLQAVQLGFEFDY